MNTVASKTWRTFDEWSSLGYKINKGSKASWHDNVPKFSHEQVTYSPPYHWGNHWRGTGIKGMDGGYDCEDWDDYGDYYPSEWDLMLGWHK